MRVLFLVALFASASAISIPIVSQLTGDLPLVGPILGGNGGSNDLLNKLPIVGNLLNTIGGVLGQLLNNILVNVGIILNAVLEIAEDVLGAVNVIVNGLLTDLLDDETIQSILDILPPSVKSLVINLVEAVKCILNDLQAAVPAVQKAVIQLIGLLVSPTFAVLDTGSQIAAILNIVGHLSQDEITMVNTILQRIADALNNKGCSTGPVTMQTAPGLPGFSGVPTIGGGNGGMTTPSGSVVTGGITSSPSFPGGLTTIDGAIGGMSTPSAGGATTGSPGFPGGLTTIGGGHFTIMPTTAGGIGGFTMGSTPAGGIGGFTLMPTTAGGIGGFTFTPTTSGGIGGFTMGSTTPSGGNGNGNGKPPGNGIGNGNGNGVGLGLGNQPPGSGIGNGNGNGNGLGLNSK